MLTNKNLQVNITSGTIFRVILISLCCVFLFLIKEVLGIVFVAWILASAVDPLIDRLQRYKIPRAVSILGVYLIMLLIVILAFYLLIPPITEQVKEITNSFPGYLQQYFPNLSIDQSNILQKIQENLQYVSKDLGNLTSGIYTAISGLFGIIATVIVVLVITFYMTVEEEGIKKFINSIAPAQYQPYINQKINRIQEKMGSWLWGQLVLMLLIGVMSGLCMYILGIKYFLVLGLIAAICEVIPIVGPVLAAVPAVFFAFADQPIKALLVIIIYTVIQQIENQIFVPKVMNKAVGLNPIIVLVAMLIGAQIAGLLGMLLAVPTSTIISVFVEDFFQGKKEEQSKLESETL